MVVFDEIQDCSRAIQSLKYFCENMPELEVQDRILKDYADDFGKHTSPATANKVRLVWDAIPSQIARDNSLHLFCKRYSPKMAIKTSLKKCGR